jgi:hypothetical protein
VIRIVGPAPYYDIKTFFGNDVRFRTATRGAVELTDKTLSVSGGKVAIPLRCASSFRCHGVVMITKRGRVTVRSHGRTRTRTVTLQFAKASFDIGADGRQRIRTNVSGACLTLVNSARNHRIGARLRARARAGQRVLNVAVTLKI